jgi:hypothetical protein
VGARNFTFSYAFTTKQGDRTSHRFEKSDKHSPRTTPLPAYGGPLPAPLVRPSSPSFLSTRFTNDDCPQVSWHIPLGRFRFVGFLACTSLIGRAQASVLAASEFRRAWPNQEVRSLWAPWPLGGNPTKPSGPTLRQDLPCAAGARNEWRRHFPESSPPRTPYRWYDLDLICLAHHLYPTDVLGTLGTHSASVGFLGSPPV